MPPTETQVGDRDRLDEFVRSGRELLHSQDEASVVAHCFRTWDREVAQWLDEKYPSTGFSADWSSRGSPLPRNVVLPSATEHILLQVLIQRRLEWLSSLGTSRASLAAPPPPTEPDTDPRRVFIVHGRDEALKEAVARVLSRLDLDPIILHELPDQGRTIIEKLMDHSNVAAAIVLATGDDVGRLKTDPDDRACERPRQNVLLELGFFLGKLSRRRVFTIVGERVEFPSDYSGVLVIPYDAHGAWKFKLAAELSSSGITVDLNRLV